MWGHPSSWFVFGDGNSTSVYNDSKYVISSWTEIVPQTAIINQPEESKEKRKRQESIWGKQSGIAKFLRTSLKIGIVIFW